MDRRPELHQVLKGIFQNDPHVYHNPPSGITTKYPCIVYKLSAMPRTHADNRTYLEHREYQLTVIDRDPDSKLREKVAQLQWCRFNRLFVTDNLYHFVFTLNY